MKRMVKFEKRNDKVIKFKNTMPKPVPVENVMPNQKFSVEGMGKIVQIDTSQLQKEQKMPKNNIKLSEINNEGNPTRKGKSFGV